MDHARYQLNSGITEREENPEVLRSQIQHTRAEIGETVHTLQDRLSADRIKHELKTAAKDQIESVKNNVRVKAEVWQSRLTDRIANNPVPAAMVGVGLIWMWKQASEAKRNSVRRNQEYYSLDPYEDWPEYAPEEDSGRLSDETSDPHNALEAVKAKAQASGQQARERISQWTGQAQNSIQEWKSRASSQKERLRTRARERGEQAKGEFQRYLQENPLTVGAMTLAIGTAIGLSLPRSEKEDQWLGETRDRLLEEAKGTVQDFIPKAKEAAAEIKHAAETSVREQAGMR